MPSGLRPGLSDPENCPPVDDCTVPLPPSTCALPGCHKEERPGQLQSGLCDPGESPRRSAIGPISSGDGHCSSEAPPWTSVGEVSITRLLLSSCQLSPSRFQPGASRARLVYYYLLVGHDHCPLNVRVAEIATERARLTAASIGCITLVARSSYLSTSVLPWQSVSARLSLAPRYPSLLTALKSQCLLLCCLIPHSTITTIRPRIVDRSSPPAPVVRSIFRFHKHSFSLSREPGDGAPSRPLSHTYTTSPELPKPLNDTWYWPGSGIFAPFLFQPRTPHAGRVHYLDMFPPGSLSVYLLCPLSSPFSWTPAAAARLPALGDVTRELAIGWPG